MEQFLTEIGFFLLYFVIAGIFFSVLYYFVSDKDQSNDQGSE